MDSSKKSEVCNEFSEIVPEMAGVFKSLGDLTRLQIIYLLATDTTGKLGVSDLAARLSISQPAVSQHLKTLKTEGLVDSRREGFYIYYTVNRERMVEFREHFELMYTSVMDKCNRELVRKSTLRPGYPGMRNFLLVFRYNPARCRGHQECQRVRPYRGQDKEAVHRVLCLHEGCPSLAEGSLRSDRAFRDRCFGLRSPDHRNPGLGVKAGAGRQLGGQGT